MAEERPPIWCIVANVVAERPYGPDGAETRRGLRRFPGGAKVWVPGGFGGLGFDWVHVIGQTRGSRRYALVNVEAGHLTTWRVRLVYSPAVLAKIDKTLVPPMYCFAKDLDRTGEDARIELERIAADFRDRTH